MPLSDAGNNPDGALGRAYTGTIGKARSRRKGELDDNLYPAQQDSLATSLEKLSAVSFSASTVVR